GLYVRPAEPDLGMRVQESNLRLEAAGKRFSVRVHAGDIFPPGGRKSPVEGRHEPEIAGIADQSDARIRVAFDDLCRAVRGPVVDDDELEVGEGLTENAVDRVAQEGRGVERRHDDRYARR